MIGKGYRLEIYQKAFESSDILFNTLGHEYVEVGLHINRFRGVHTLNHYSASKWSGDASEVAKYDPGEVYYKYSAEASKRYEFFRMNNNFGLPNHR